MSEYFSVALSIEYILITHQESEGIIYYQTAPGVELDPKLIELFRRAIQFEELDMPAAEGEIEQATLEGKYLVTRAGKMVWVTLIINEKPTRFTREALHSFSIKFENRYAKEIKYLYSKFKGNIQIFRQESATRESVDGLINEVFKLNLSLPHKLGFPTGKKMTRGTKKIWNLAEDMAHDTKGAIFLGELFSKAKKNLKYDNKSITDSIINLVDASYLKPMSLERYKQRYS
ncbi:MAG: hypothetical protein R6U96_13925 [Promethearchaeia archaeon]